MKRIFLVGICCLISFASWAQEKPDFTRPDVIFQRDRYTVGYFGNMFVNPGIQVGYETVFKEREKTKEKRKRSKHKYKQYLWSHEAGFYSHPQSYDLGFYQLSIKNTRILNRNWLRSYQFGFGLSRSFVGETYQVVNDQVKRIPLAGTFYFYPQVKYEVGKRILKREAMINEVRLGLSSMLLLDYNNFGLPLINFECMIPLNTIGGKHE